MAERAKVSPILEDAKSEQYRYVFATGVFGGLDPDDAQMIFWLDRAEPGVNTSAPDTTRLKKKICELQVEVHMTPALFKIIADWMNKHIERYEKKYGPIPLRPMKAKKPVPTGVYT